jgi:hypothetical protein
MHWRRFRRSIREVAMTAAHPSLPLTVAGRSPFDEVRVRWGGFGALAFGIGLLFSGTAGGIVFGILLAVLGGAALALSRVRGRVLVRHPDSAVPRCTR